MGILRYFDLGFGNPVTLGGSREEQEKQRKANARRRVLLTLFMYFGVFLGVLGESIFRIVRTKSAVESAFDIGQLIVALILAVDFFPLVFPKLFGHMKGPKYGHEDLPFQERFLQFCLAFQNGFFWQSLVHMVA